MRNVLTAAPETDKPTLLVYSPESCLDHILAKGKVFRSFFDELKQTRDGIVVAVQVTAKSLKPVRSGQKVCVINGPQATVALPKALSAQNLLDATHNNAYGYHLLAAVHKRVCDASKMTGALERLYASCALQLDIEALVHVISRHVSASAQTNGGEE